MKVILLKDVKGTGKKGDVVTVSDGYANNYLIPNKIAQNANATNVNLNNQAKSSEAHKAEVILNDAKELKQKLDNLSIELSIKCGENGKTFGSVTSKEIADKLLSLGFEIDKKKIDFSPVKTIGLYHVKIKLHPQVATTINVNIVSQK